MIEVLAQGLPYAFERLDEGWYPPDSGRRDAVDDAVGALADATEVSWRGNANRRMIPHS